MLPASFRGIRFNALSIVRVAARRYAVHEYPFRDDVWAENLGRAANRYIVDGFFVNGGFGKGYAADQMTAALVTWIKPGMGHFVHPTLGTLALTMLDMAETQKWENGRYVGFRALFVATPKSAPQFPGVQTNTAAAVTAAATAAKAAAATDFLTKAASALKSGLSAVNMAVSTVAKWARAAQSLINDATNLYNMVGSLIALPGQLGRYFGGRSKTLNGNSVSIPSATSVTALIGAGAVARGTYSAAQTNLAAAAASLTAGTAPAFAAAAQALADAVAASAVDPADAVRLLTSLASPLPTAPTTATPTGVAMATMQSATGDLFRRSAVIALAQASSTYQPSSYDDAASLRSAMAALIEAEITMAGDQGEDATYLALRTLLGAVVQDLTARGGSLASVVTVTVGASLPALALAQRLYQDPGRAGELVTQASPRHPAFMPLSFKALAK
ncbi:MAG TPA: DNA circularization N-terminal domain-containing protein [Patescibacteria group bacterium]|nr:DNA circularization N-terminal domain-containing protein [Patescibacteria group bacterium]